MTGLEQSLRRLTNRLLGLNARFAVIGGLAVSVRAEPRFTQDADLAVAVDHDADAERLISSLATDGYRATAIVEQVRLGRIATVRMVGPSGQILLDLMFASCGIEPEIIASADQVEVLPQLHLPVATVGHFIAMKLLSRDDAVGLITARGFNRGRDLKRALDRLRAKPTSHGSLR